MNQTFEEFLLEYTERDIDYHINAGTTGLDFARKCWNRSSKITQQDIHDIKTTLKEQLDSLERLGKIPLPLGSVPTDKYQEIITIYSDIIECNKVMTEIINGVYGTMERTA